MPLIFRSSLGLKCECMRRVVCKSWLWKRWCGYMQTPYDPNDFSCLYTPKWLAVILHCIKGKIWSLITALGWGNWILDSTYVQSHILYLCCIAYNGFICFTLSQLYKLISRFDYSTEVMRMEHCISSRKNILVTN